MFFHKNATGRIASVWWFCYCFHALFPLKVCHSEQEGNLSSNFFSLSEYIKEPTQQPINALGMVLVQPWGNVQRGQWAVPKPDRDLVKAGKQLVTFTSLHQQQLQYPEIEFWDSYKQESTQLAVRAWKHQLRMPPPLNILKCCLKLPVPRKACPT